MTDHSWKPLRKVIRDEGHFIVSFYWKNIWYFLAPQRAAFNFLWLFWVMWAYKLIWNRLKVVVLFQPWSCKLFSQEQDNNAMCNNNNSHLETAIQHCRDMIFFPILYTPTQHSLKCQVFQVIQVIQYLQEVPVRQENLLMHQITDSVDGSDPDNTSLFTNFFFSSVAPGALSAGSRDSIGC